MSAQITVRVPPELKKQFEAAAKRDGLSLNAWMIVAANNEKARRK